MPNNEPLRPSGTTKMGKSQAMHERPEVITDNLRIQRSFRLNQFPSLQRQSISIERKNKVVPFSWITPSLFQFIQKPHLPDRNVTPIGRQRHFVSANIFSWISCFYCHSLLEVRYTCNFRIFIFLLFPIIFSINI